MSRQGVRLSCLSHAICGVTLRHSVTFSTVFFPSGRDSKPRRIDGGGGKGLDPEGEIVWDDSWRRFEEEEGRERSLVECKKKTGWREVAESRVVRVENGTQHLLETRSSVLGWVYLMERRKARWRSKESEVISKEAKSREGFCLICLHLVRDRLTSGTAPSQRCHWSQQISHSMQQGTRLIPCERRTQWTALLILNQIHLFQSDWLVCDNQPVGLKLIYCDTYCWLSTHAFQFKGVYINIHQLSNRHVGPDSCLSNTNCLYLQFDYFSSPSPKWYAKQSINTQKIQLSQNF